jgi:hypothetical protein
MFKKKRRAICNFSYEKAVILLCEGLLFIGKNDFSDGFSL